MQEVLQCLKKHGQRLDLEIAAEMRVPLATVRKLLAELSAAGEVVMCQLTRYEGSKTIEAWQCRVSGFVPAPAPGVSRRRRSGARRPGAIPAGTTVREGLVPRGAGPSCF